MESRVAAVLVPGGGLLPDGEVTSWVKRRLDKAQEIWSQNSKDGRPVFVITLSGGTTHKPPVRDRHDFVIHECAAAAKYLIQAGVPGTHIVQEWSSYDTIGNAYFARLQHTEPRQWQNLVIVTSEFHMPRTQAIFEWVFRLPWSEDSNSSLPYHLQFVAVSDVGVMEQGALESRRAKEKKSLQSLLQTISRVKSLSTLHEFLFSEHAAYSTNQRFQSHPSLSVSELKSY